MREYSMHWRDFIDDGLSLKEQLKEFTPWAKALEKFIKLEEEKTIKITNLRNFPSSITWHVLNEKAYQEAQRKWDLHLNKSVKPVPAVKPPIKEFLKVSKWVGRFRGD